MDQQKLFNVLFSIVTVLGGFGMKSNVGSDHRTKTHRSGIEQVGWLSQGSSSWRICLQIIE